MIKQIKRYIKDKLGITKLLSDNERLQEEVRKLRISHFSTEKRIEQSEDFISDKLAALKEYTRVDADVGIRGNNTIILTGVFNNKAYVRFYDMGDGEFKRMAHQMKDMQQHSLIRHVDEPWSCNFKGMFDLE